MFYADGGAKGISLSIEQYTALIQILPDIEGVLKSKDIEVPRPQYDEAITKTIKESEAVDDDEDDEEEVETSKSKGRLEKYKLKRNHDATSDEDED